MLQEGQLRISLPPSCSGRKFDDHSHGLSHCMKAVDFIIETPNSIIFLEIKDPDSAPPERRQAYTEELVAGIVDNDLKYKFRDTWLYLHATQKLNKPVNFFVVIGLSSLTSEALAARSTALSRQLPLSGVAAGWANPLANTCKVFNIETWNRVLAEFLIVRH